tara:strand:+ start:348 stop:470 length:123 start_codon:yes stop_codon:yes gene_type:complete
VLLNEGLKEDPSLLINRNGSRRLLNPKFVRKVSNTAIAMI